MKKKLLMAAMAMMSAMTLQAQSKVYMTEEISSDAPQYKKKRIGKDFTLCRFFFILLQCRHAVLELEEGVEACY